MGGNGNHPDSRDIYSVTDWDPYGRDDPRGIGGTFYSPYPEMGSDESLCDGEEGI